MVACNTHLMEIWYRQSRLKTIWSVLSVPCRSSQGRLTCFRSRQGSCPKVVRPGKLNPITRVLSVPLCLLSPDVQIEGEGHLRGAKRSAALLCHDIPRLTGVRFKRANQVHRRLSVNFLLRNASAGATAHCGASPRRHSMWDGMILTSSALAPLVAAFGRGRSMKGESCISSSLRI